MNVLGISCYFHDAAAALLADGKLVAAAEEERFTRVKHDYEFPRRAIEFCLAKAGVRAEELDQVVFFEKPFVKFESLPYVLSGFASSGLRSVIIVIRRLSSTEVTGDLIAKCILWMYDMARSRHADAQYTTMRGRRGPERRLAVVRRGIES